MLTAKQLWAKKRVGLKKNGRGRKKDDLKRAMRLVEKVLLQASPIRHQSGSRMLIACVSCKDLKLGREEQVKLESALERNGYILAWQGVTGWPIEGDETPYRLEVVFSNQEMRPNERELQAGLPLRLSGKSPQTI